MTLTAREWLILSKEEQKKRRKELSSEECFRLRTDLEFIHFTEEEKENMSEEQRYKFTHSSKPTQEEQKAFNLNCDEVFKTLMAESEEK